MLGGKTTVFISCSEKYKETVAWHFRDACSLQGWQGVIVSDLPKRGSAWGPEDKVEFYLNRSDMMVALLTPDDHHDDDTWWPRHNITDELARARRKDHLRDMICVLKAPAVSVPSNIDPVYDTLNPSDPLPAIQSFLRQAQAWEFDVRTIPDDLLHANPSASVSADDVLGGTRADDPVASAVYVRERFQKMDKAQQRSFVAAIAHLVATDTAWERLMSAGHIVEAVAEIDPGLVTIDLVEKMAWHPEFSVRSSSAMVLFIEACSSPGTVPIDLVARLARPAEEDWYVFMPALNALKQLALSRPEAVAALSRLASSPEYADREYSASALVAVAEVKAVVVPRELAKRVAADADHRLAELGKRLLKLLADVSEDDAGHPYSPFFPF